MDATERLINEETEKMRREEQLGFDSAPLAGLPETVTHAQMLDRCARLWQQGDEHE